MTATTKALTLGAVAAGAGAWHWLRRGADPSRLGDGEARQAGEYRIALPMRYHRSDCFVGVFSADSRRLRTLLPSPQLHPVEVSPGRAAIAVAAYNYIDCSVAPYGEVGVAALCTLGYKAPSLLPLLLESRWPGFGAFVLHLPVTTQQAREAGRRLWGYPKFVADMVFDTGAGSQSVEVGENGVRILNLTVSRRGCLVGDQRPLITYSELDGQLTRTTVPTAATYRLGRHATLELGGHEVGRWLRDLDISHRALFTKSYLQHRAALQLGVPLMACDAYAGYRGMQSASV